MCLAQRLFVDRIVADGEMNSESSLVQVSVMEMIFWSEL
jgi:hypothetical protein